MDLVHSNSFLTHVGRRFYYWTSVAVILWIIQSDCLPVGNSYSITANTTKQTHRQFHTHQSQIPQVLLSNKNEVDPRPQYKSCEGCKLGRNDEPCSGQDQGECTCTNENVIVACTCKAGWIGDACQYQISKISCEKMRNCILCEVYRSGPLAEADDCQHFCDHNYPTPLVVKTLHFQDDEHLCSFIHPDATKTAECRYFFKYGQVNNGNISPENFYVVAQQEMDCGKPVKFPTLKQFSYSENKNQSFETLAKNYDQVAKASDNDDPGMFEELKRKNSLLTIVIVFILIALPVVTCVFSLIYNFSTLPCGLCNVFRQSSSKYIRNVRPFPGFVGGEEDEMTSM